MLSVHCPNCGGTNIFDETKQIPTYCAFCASHLPDMTEFVQESLKLSLDKQHHKMDMEKMDKEIKKERIESSTHKIIFLILFVFIIIFGIIMVKIINQ